MDYQVFAPDTELQPFVKCFWTMEADRMEEPVKQRILPDGCMEMMFHYGDGYRQYFHDGSSILQPKSFVFGQITNYIEVEPTGMTGIVSARFLPEGLTPFLEIPVSMLANKAVSIADIFGEKGTELEKEVMTTAGNQQRIKIIEAFLLSLLTTPQAIDIITRTCVEVIFQSHGQLGITELADKVKLNRRNMERKFTSVIGMSPKQLSKVVRLQATLKMLDKQRFNSLTSLAYENGYYDQAHFIKDFREFTGMSPKLFFAKNLRYAAMFASAE
jgi:AraC-like DNA-binding protein